MTPPDPDQLLEALDPQQREVALQVTGPLCVRAGAGTGKTRAITYRIAYGAAIGAVDPSTVLAVTFTAKAAAEMGARLRALGAGRARAQTFHAAALRQLIHFWPRVTGGPAPVLAPVKAPLVAAAASRVGIRTDKLVIRDLAAELEWAKVSMVVPEGYAEYARQQGRTPPTDLEVDHFSRFYEAYEQTKDTRGVIDFEDVLLLQCGLLEEREDVAAAVRSRYRSFVVDEYQDVSPVQQHLLDLWRGDRRDLCVVGDVAQTIYSFTGASATYLEDFPRRMKGARVVELVRDYRSTPQVVALANQIVAASRGMDGTARAKGLPGSVRLRAQRPSGPAVSFSEFETDRAEAEGVAARVTALKRGGVPLGQIAVLYRINSQSEVLEETFEDSGIPFQVRGGARFFDREEIRRAVVLLRQQARVGSLVGSSLPPLVETVKEVVRSLGWREEAPAASGAVRDRWANLDALLEMARSAPDRPLDAFMEELEERAAAKASPTVEGVVLSTLHAAKGLEWDAVFIVGASEGLIPFSLAQSPEAIEEERRLLYVGVTRAREHLDISYAQTRSAGRRSVRPVSRFLAPLWPREERIQDRKTPAKKSGRRDDTKAFLENADPGTAKLFEELRQWRLREARAADKPAYTIMPDASLRQVAEARPRTIRQLGALRGIGPARLDQWGAELLRIVRSHLA